MLFFHLKCLFVYAKFELRYCGKSKKQTTTLQSFNFTKK